MWQRIVVGSGVDRRCTADEVTKLASGGFWVVFRIVQRCCRCLAVGDFSGHSEAIVLRSLLRVIRRVLFDSKGNADAIPTPMQSLFSRDVSGLTLGPGDIQLRLHVISNYNGRHDRSTMCQLHGG